MLGRAARQGSCRASPCAARAATRNSSCASCLIPPLSSSLKHQHRHDGFVPSSMCPSSHHAPWSTKIKPTVQWEQMRRTSTTSASISSSGDALSLSRSRRVDGCCILTESSHRLRPDLAGLLPYSTATRTFGLAGSSRCVNEPRDRRLGGGGAPVRSFVRTFGGQSVVPWELALFLVEEMKGEGVEPGSVVYTAALAECRWAGQTRHVDYLRQQMEAEGMTIVPGIPGATDDHLPPSQAPPLFDKASEPPPTTSTSGNGFGTPQHNSVTPEEEETRQDKSTSITPKGENQDKNASSGVSAAIAAATAAAKTADKALATVEALWAMEAHEPSPKTCRAALDACAVGGQWERALSLVRDSAGEVDSDDDSDGDNVNISRRVEGLALAGRWTDAFLLVQQQGTE